MFTKLDFLKLGGRKFFSIHSTKVLKVGYFWIFLFLRFCQKKLHSTDIVYIVHFVYKFSSDFYSVKFRFGVLRTISAF